MKQIRQIVSVIINGKQQVISDVVRSTDLTLEDLEDVSITSPAIGDTIVWDGNFWILGSASPTPPTITITAGIAAHAGGGQGSATACTAVENFIDTVTTVDDSLQIGVLATPGLLLRFHNMTANNAKLYPKNGATNLFKGQAANDPIDLPGYGMVIIACATGETGTWRWY